MTADEPTDAERGERADRYESIVETISDGVFVLDRDGTIVFVNGAIEAFLGIDRETLVGTTFGGLTELGLFDTAEYERFFEAFETVRDGVEADSQLTVELGPTQVLEIRLSADQCDGTDEEIVGTVRDVTQRVQALESLERQQRAIYRLYEADVDADLTTQEKIERALEIGCEFLDLPIGFLSSIDGAVQRYDHVVGDAIEAGSTRPLAASYCRYTVESDDPVAIRDAETELGPEEPTYVDTGLSCYIGTKIPVGGELYGTFCFAAADARDRSFSHAEREFVRLLGLWAGHNLERQHFETVLRGLHELGQELLLADTKAEVARLGVDTSSELFDLSITACWRYEGSTDSLRPIAETPERRRALGETTVLDGEDALVRESFDAGEIRIFEDVADEIGTRDPGTPLESAIHIPLGDQGVLVAGSAEPRAFEAVNIDSLRLLGDLLRDALIDVEQRETLVERGEALQRQNEQLEEFAHVVAHDLRNPLAGAIGFLEIARETHDDSHFDRVETSLERMKDLIEQLLDIARGSRQAVDPRGLSLAEVVEEAWSYVDTEDAMLTVSDDLGEIHADETRLLQLFGNLFRNSVEHGSRGPDSQTRQDSAEHDGTAVTVEVGRLESGAGFYVEDDGPGLSEEARENVLTLGKTTSESGTGIGLDSVTDIVEAHGWELAIPDTDGGARFEIRTSETEEAEI